MKRYRPLIDKLYYVTATVALAIVFLPSLILSFMEPYTILIMLPIFLLTAYFFVSALHAYVELRESGLFIKYGFILKREIPYDKIRSVEKERRVISTSTLSIKNALDHINIKYGTFDVTTVSLKDSEDFLIKLNERCGGKLL